MQKYKNHILYSASDLCHFIECQHMSALDIRNLSERMSKTEDSDDAKLIQKKGHEHEARYVEVLKGRGLSVIDIKQQVDAAIASLPEGERTLEGKNDLAHHCTVMAMKEGYDVIYQATFLHDALIGHADFLRRVAQPSALGDFSYEVMDTKLSRTEKSKFLTQLVFYSKLLSLAQGSDPGYMVVVLGDMSELVYRYVDYKFTVERQLKRFQNFVKSLEAQQQTYPSPCAKCDQCHWRDRCKQQWEDDDHLCRIANITSGQLHKLNEAGVSTMAQLATLNPQSRVEKMQMATLKNLVKQAELQKRGEREGKPIYELRPLKAEDKKGFYRLPAPSQFDLYFDMEGNPLIQGGLEYLFGLWLFDDGRYAFKAFWAHNRAEEKRAFEAFIDFVTQHLRLHPDVHIYHYAAYEETALKKLASLHGTRESQVDTLLRGQKLVDLYKVVKESLWVSEPRYSIKNIEHFYRLRREGDVQNAGASIVMYERWMEEGGEDLLQKIADYNKDDVESTYQLHVWLQQIMRQAGVTFPITGVPTSMAPVTSTALSPTPAAAPTAAEAFETQLATYIKPLLADLPDDETTWTQQQRVQELVFHLLGFFRRKMKPVWWAMFNRCDMEPHEWLDDPECLGEICITNREEVENKKGVIISIRYAATFKAQELKWTDIESALIYPPRVKAKVEAFSTDDFTISFAVKPDQDDLWSKAAGAFALGKEDSFLDAHLQPAVFRFADALIAQKQLMQAQEEETALATSVAFPYQALVDFLFRQAPNISGVSKGEAIVKSGDDVSVMVQRILAMNNTCTVVQGPPGTGKTYSGSRMITAAIAAGKTVGVCSSSHKAIHNLLNGVLKAAAEIRMSIRGAKKVTKNNDESYFYGDGFDNYEDAAQILKQTGGRGYQLIAGTVWLFAKAEADQLLDYLFVDEAGQVSVANLVAMGVSARNIVLLGDQMQLGQPIQGVHPGDSGLSALDYLLRGHATVPPEMGIFLGVSYRMNPEVCRFISDAVYDGRLQSASSAVKQRIVLQAGAHSALAQSGVRYVPVDHEGCSQYSPEEVALVLELLDSLLKQQVMDGAGHIRAMTLQDVLVVAPYNVQVNELTKALPTGARVGTVDKLQGQEAEVVIVSMTTSSGDDLPRFMDFLFSKNRLNVAISRAKCLALFVANPRLMDISCSTPEQMALVNTVCWVADPVNPAR